MPPPRIYEEDLAFIHDAGYSGFARGCAPGVLEVFARSGIQNGLIVDVGCGGGVWAQQLDRAGYEVEGIDSSPAMILLARQRVPTARLLIQSVWSYDFPRCRAVTALGEVVCYRADGKASPDALRELCVRVFQSLDAGGLFVFDVVEAGVSWELRPVFSQDEDWACLVNFELDEQRQLLTRYVTAFRKNGDTFRRTREKHVVQLYHADHVSDFLREAGFRVRRVRKFGAFPLLSNRIGFVARKP